MARELYSTSLFNDDNLVAYYRLEDTNDSKNSYNLTNNNSVAFNPAKFNNGADFGTSNTNKYLSISNNLGITGGNITLSFWLKLNTEIGSGTYDLIDQESLANNTGNYVTYEYNGGTRRLTFNRVRQYVVVNSAAYNITLGTSSWYYVVYTYDGSNIRGYVNGSLVAGPVASSGYGTAGGMNRFTVGWGGVGGYTSGIIDDVAVFSRALSPTEISNFYNLGPPGVFFHNFL